MVTLGFVIDLPRLSAWSVDDVTKFLKEVAAKFVFSIMLDEPADKISVFYITKTPQVMNVAYKAGSGNFRGNVFEKAVKNLPTVPKEMGSELTSDDLIKILTYQPLYTMGCGCRIHTLKYFY